MAGRRVKRFARGFIPAIKATDWLDWFWLSWVVFASALFWAVLAELQKEFRG